MPKPNILYIHSHDSGRWMEPYCSIVPTPNIRRFAESATVFNNAHTPSPTCSPSRGCLLTGTHPHQNGLTGLAHLGFKLAHPEWHLAHFLQSSGYRTLLCGIQHEASGSNEDILSELGYDQYIGDETPGVEPMDRDHLHAVKARDFLLQTTADDDPFFLSVGFFNTHRPYQHDKAWEGPLPPGLKDSAASRIDFHGYAQSLQLLDQAIGVVLGGLEKSVCRENTIVVLTTDHGPAYPGMKCTPTTEGTGVALMIRPVLPPKKQSCDALVSLLDVYPTLCEWTSLQPTAPLAGRSLIPLMENQLSEIHDNILISINYHVSADFCRALRTKDYLLVKYFPPKPEVPALANIDDGPLRQSLLESEELYQRREQTILYRIAANGVLHKMKPADTQEGLLNELHQDLLQRMKDSNDPLLQGSPPIPSGARQLDKSAVSAAAIRTAKPAMAASLECIS